MCWGAHTFDVKMLKHDRQWTLCPQSSYVLEQIVLYASVIISNSPIPTHLLLHESGSRLRLWWIAVGQ